MKARTPNLERQNLYPSSVPVADTVPASVTKQGGHFREVLTAIIRVGLERFPNPDPLLIRNRLHDLVGTAGQPYTNAITRNVTGRIIGPCDQHVSFHINIKSFGNTRPSENNALRFY
jgi:hypothetical protein